jgi:hypothetical protein
MAANNAGNSQSTCLGRPMSAGEKEQSTILRRANLPSRPP